MKLKYNMQKPFHINKTSYKAYRQNGKRINCWTWGFEVDGYWCSDNGKFFKDDEKNTWSEVGYSSSSNVRIKSVRAFRRVLKKLSKQNLLPIGTKITLLSVWGGYDVVGYIK